MTTNEQQDDSIIPSRTNLDIDALHATWKAATPGEWRMFDPVTIVTDEANVAVTLDGGTKAGEQQANGELTCALHNAWPAIAERLRELEAENTKLRAAYTEMVHDRGRFMRERDEAAARADREAALRQTAEDTLEYLRTRHADGTWSSVTVGDFCTSRAAVAGTGQNGRRVMGSDDELLTRVDNWLAAAQESDDDETEELMRDLRDAIVDHGLRELTDSGQ